MDKQPEALRLADSLQSLGNALTVPNNEAHQAAAELRRQHNECEMKEAAYQTACAEIRKLEAVNAELLGALRHAVDMLGSASLFVSVNNGLNQIRLAQDRAHAAITNATKEQP